MIVLDTCAVIAALDREPAAPAVVGLLDEGSALTAVGVGELIDQRLRVAGRSLRETTAALAALGVLDPIDIDEDIGKRAGVLRATYHRQWGSVLSLADCIAAATAETMGVPLATSDAHLLDMAYKEGIKVHPLPTSTGRMWAEPRDE